MPVSHNLCHDLQNDLHLACCLQINHHMWVKEHCSQDSNLPILLGTANYGGKIWLVTPYYGPVLASLRSPAMIVDATLQASLQLSVHLCFQQLWSDISLALQAAHAIEALTMNGHFHGDVSPHNIAYQDSQGVLIDLATLRPFQQVLTSLCNT